MAEKSFDLEIVTPEGSVFSGKVESLFAPGYEGYFQILYNHAPYLVSLKIGEIKLRIKNQDNIYATSGGFAEVNNNQVIILAETAENANEINVERAEKSKHRAEERLSKKGEDIDIERAEMSLRRAINRIQIARKAGV